MIEPFPCNSCGGPNEPVPGANRMACSYCGANLTIPENLRVPARSRVVVKPAQTNPVSGFDQEAPDLLRKAQPIAIKAWNAYAYWTWIRWLLPTCLTLLVIGLVVCAIVSVLPFTLFR